MFDRVWNTSLQLLKKASIFFQIDKMERCASLVNNIYLFKLKIEILEFTLVFLLLTLNIFHTFFSTAISHLFFHSFCHCTKNKVSHLGFLQKKSLMENFTVCGVSIVDFEQVNVSWEVLHDSD